MKRKDVRNVLASMADCAAFALPCPNGMTREGFLADRRRQAGVMNPPLIGERASTLRRTCATELPNLPALPYEQMIGMRNRIARAYFDQHADTARTVATRSFPGLRHALARIGITGVDGLTPLEKKS